MQAQMAQINSSKVNAVSIYLKFKSEESLWPTQDCEKTPHFDIMPYVHP
jgi:hypothetical protein